MLRMPMHAHGFTFNKCRSFTGPGTLISSLSGQIDGCDIIAVHNFTRYGIGFGAFDHICNGHLIVKRRGVGVLVVIAEEDNREPADGGEIQRLVKIAATGASISRVSCDNAGFATDPECQSGSDEQDDGSSSSAVPGPPPPQDDKPHTRRPAPCPGRSKGSPRQTSAACRSVSTTGRRSTSRRPHQPAASASSAPAARAGQRHPAATRSS